MSAVEIDHECTDELVCAYCGREHRDSWEYHADSGDADCEMCERTFHYERIVDVSYSTSKLKEPKP